MDKVSNKKLSTTSIKRQAKKIRKEEQITHTQALNKIVQQNGFYNWKHYCKTIKTLPTTYSQAKKIDPYRNLLVAGLNILLEKKLISLDIPLDNQDNSGYIFTNLFGFSSVIIWRSISFDEITLSVWWKYNHNLHPQGNLEGNGKECFKDTSPLTNRNNYKKFLGIAVSGWIERRNGKYIQGENRQGLFDIYTRQGELKQLESISMQIPNGFEVEGKFYL